MRNSILRLALISQITLLSVLNTSAVTYPWVTPAGESTGGTFQLYFDNMYTAPCPMGQVIWWFTSSGVLQCTAPVASWLYVTGQTLGDTLRFDGTNWIRNNLIFNDGSNVGIGATVPAAKLDVNGTVKISWGTPGSGKVLTSDATGLASWQTPTSSTSWELLGNAWTVAGTNFLGTTDDISLVFKVNAIRAGFIGNTADNNIMFGRWAGSTVAANSSLVALWVNALNVNVSGTNNTAVWYLWLFSNISWNQNTAVGANSLLLSTGNNNTSLGHNAGSTLTAGNNNIFIGAWVAPNIATTASNQLNIGDWIYGNSGSIGIGVLNPGAKLDIAGTIKITDGTQGAGRVLMSDANGLAYWWIAAASQVYASWVIGWTEYYVPRFMLGWSGLTISQIYDNSTNVGIGTAVPWAKLDVNGTIKISWGSPWAGKVLISDAVGLASWGNPTLASSVYATGVLAMASSGGYITKFMAGGSGITNSLMFESGSFIGVNTTNPLANLHISGSFLFADGNQWSGKTLISDAIGRAMWGVPTVSTTVYATGVIGLAGSGGYLTKFLPSGSGITSAVVFESGGYIGINATNPTAGLDVNGQIRMRTGASSGLVLVSDTNGVASWQVAPTATTVSATGITWGTVNYIPKFGTGWNGLYISQIFDDGTNVGIGISSPSYKLHVGGDAFFTGNVTVQGNLIVDKIVNRSVNNVSISGSLLPDSSAPLAYRDIGSGALRWNNLYLSGQVAIGGGSPWLGKFLISDANGLASWTGLVTATSLNIAGATVGNTLYFDGTNWVPSNNIYNAGTNIGLGIRGTAPTPTSALEAWSGGTTQSLMHFRGSNNVGFWLNAVRYLTTGSANVGFGNNVLRTITTGYSNSALGDSALYNNMQGYFNTALGTQALYTNTNGNWNIALGTQALYTNLGWTNNVGIGWQALYLNSAGNYNTALGDSALRTTTGNNNVGIGYGAWSGITTGSNNIAIGYGAQVYNNTASNQLSIGNWIYGSGGFVGIGVTNPLANLDIAGTIKIAGGSPWLGKVLTSDVNGLASWSNALSGATATGITGWVQNYVAKFGTGGNGLYASQIFDNGARIGIGTGTNLTARLNIDSGSGGFSWLRFLNINSTSTVTSTNIVGLGVNGSGEVVPISNWDVIVYDGITTGTPSPDPNNSTRQISYDFNKYFRIPAKQSFVITDGLSPGQNAPYIGENAAVSVCEWTGTYGTGMSTCPSGDFPGSPYNSFTMSARADSNYGYQIGLAYRGDIQLMARSGKFRDGNDAGTDVDFDDYGSGLYIGATNNPAPWYKVITLPTNQMQWFYIDTGYTGQWNTTGKAGMIGIGTTDPNYGLDIRSTVGMMNRVYLTGTTASAGSPTLSFDGDTNMGIFRPAADTLAVSTSGTEAMRVFSDGNVSIGSTTNSAKLRVQGQVMITGGTPGAGKVLTSDANGLATWTTPAAWDILQATVNKNLPSIANNACSAQTFAVTGAATGKTAWLSPASALNDRLFITYARVSAANTVEAKFCNVSGAAIDMAAMDFYVSVMQ